MKKQLTAVFLAIVMITALIPVSAASDGALFKICVPENMPKAGESFEVKVDLSNNPGFCGIQFALEYDTAAMKCEYVDLGENLSRAISVTNPNGKNGAIVAAVSLKTLKGDGTVAYFGFVAKKDITDFEFGMKDVAFTNEELNEIPFKVEGEEPTENLPSIPGNNPEEDEPVDDSAKPERPADENYIGAGENEKAEESTGVDNETIVLHNFKDVIGHWAEPYIAMAAEKGLFVGDTNGNYNPDSYVTRAQFVTVLWRLAGKPDVSEEVPFTDVENQIPEFQNAIKWGYANGYINGTSATTFEPDGSLTREAAMKILHAYSGGKIGAEIQFYDIYRDYFKDGAEISEWARSSIYWGIYNKLISGISEELLAPKGLATRAQLAKILINYIDINKI